MKTPSEEIRDYHDQQKSMSKQFLEQCEYEARKVGLIFVPSQGRAMTQEEYDHWFFNAVD